MIKKDECCKQNIINEIDTEGKNINNPLMIERSNSIVLSDYTQETPISKHDKDCQYVMETAKLLNNSVPYSFPVYNYNIDEINGERFYKPDGSLLFIRISNKNTITDYYNNLTSSKSRFSVARILERDKISGRLKVKIAPFLHRGTEIRTNITIFDNKTNNKYLLIQLLENFIVTSITEFSGNGNAFKTLFRDTTTGTPFKLTEGRSEESDFKMLDVVFGKDGRPARMKYYSKKNEINIHYSDNKKIINTKTFK